MVPILVVASAVQTRATPRDTTDRNLGEEDAWEQSNITRETITANLGIMNSPRKQALKVIAPDTVLSKPKNHI